MLFLENDDLKVGFLPFGAELRSVVNKKTGHEYMWDANPEFWGRVSPVLFPIVGRLKDGTYSHSGTSYALPQHGFLRDQVLDVVKHTEDTLSFAFQSGTDFLNVYPFEHEVTITYTLKQNNLEVSWHVSNKSDDTMIYGIGAHPAFKLDDSKTYEFFVEGTEQSQSYELAEGLISKSEAAPGTHEFTVSKSLFDKDTLIYDNARRVLFEATDKSMGIECTFETFPFIALWTNFGTREKAPFICIEPWCGIADFVDADGVLAHKRGMNTLGVNESQTHTYELRFI